MQFQPATADRPACRLFHASCSVGSEEDLAQLQIPGDRPHRPAVPEVKRKDGSTKVRALPAVPSSAAERAHGWAACRSDPACWDAHGTAEGSQLCGICGQPLGTGALKAIPVKLGPQI